MFLADLAGILGQWFFSLAFRTVPIKKAFSGAAMFLLTQLGLFQIFNVPFLLYTHISPIIFVPIEGGIVTTQIREQLFLPGIPHPGIVVPLSISSYDEYSALTGMVFSIGHILTALYVGLVWWRLRGKSLIIFILLNLPIATIPLLSN